MHQHLDRIAKERQSLWHTQLTLSVYFIQNLLEAYFLHIE
jgi:hypothetical protein